jgi:hypothetical protein
MSMTANSAGVTPRNSWTVPNFQPAASRRFRCALSLVYFPAFALSYWASLRRHVSMTESGVVAVFFAKTSNMTIASGSLR